MHDHVVVVIADHLWVLALSHDHASWVVLIGSTVVLLADNELLLLLLLVAYGTNTLISLHDLALGCSFSSLLTLSLS